MRIRTHRIIGVGACALAGWLVFSSVVSASELRRRGMVGVQVAPRPAPEEGQEAVKGVLVAFVVPGGAAEQAGLKSMDIITHIGDTPLEVVPDFMQAIRNYYAGDKAPLKIVRNEETMTIEVVLAERPGETSDVYELIYDSVTVKDARHPEAAALRLRTFVTKPKAEGKRPAVLLIPSPGANSMELSPQMANHPYRKLLDAMTKAGLVTLRVDRVGVGESDGRDAMETDLALDVESYRAAAKKLATYDFVDTDRVFIYAFGMGSAIAPLAAKDSGVRGVVLYGSTIARPLTVSLPQQMRRMWWLYDPDDAALDEKVKMATEYLKLCEKGTKPGDAMDQVEGLREHMRRFGRQRDDHVVGIYHPYFLNICETDYAKAWGEVSVDVLVLWGDADYQANREDSEFIAQAVNRKSAGRAKFKALNQCDHVGNKADDQEDSFLTGYTAGDFNPVLVQTIVEWVDSRGGGST